MNLHVASTVCLCYVLCFIKLIRNRELEKSMDIVTGFYSKNKFSSEVKNDRGGSIFEQICDVVIALIKIGKCCII